jgi:hypothetical protein
MAKSKELKEIRDFVIHLINKEQDEHAELINKLREKLGFGIADNTFNVLSRLHETRIKLLEDIYEKIKSL